MAWPRRLAAIGCAALLWAVALAVLDPNPPEARASVACDVGGASVDAITGGFGIGNVVGDACNTATDPVLGLVPDPLDPIKDAAESIGQGVFDQITSWAAEGAVWLLGRVVALTNKTTSPNLLSKGFLRQYHEMASIAAVLALLMLLFAALESLGRGDGGMLVRVFLVNVPLAAIATSAAYVVVQLLIAMTDGISEAVTTATAEDTRAFFKSAIKGLSGAGATWGGATSGPGAGEASGAVAVPLFVGFIVAIIAAVAAFFLWIELLMRDAAIYVTALFMPLALAASIWPRWMPALRRTAELLIVVVFSKFAIVAIIALAASLLANAGGDIEHVLAAGALLLLACFAPFVLFRLVPFAEGAVSSAFNRQSAGGASARAIRNADSSVQMMRRTAVANWSTKASGASSGGAGSSVSLAQGRSGGNGRVGGAAGADATGASGGAAGAVALPAVAGAGAVKGTKAAADKLAESGTAQAGGEVGVRTQSSSAGTSSAASGTGSQGSGIEGAPRPRSEGSSSEGARASSPAPSSTPEPTEAKGGQVPGEGTKPPRPSGEAGAAKDGPAGNAKS